MTGQDWKTSVVKSSRRIGCYIAMNNYTCTYTCRNIFNTIKTSGHSSLEKYTSHFIWKGSKGLRRVLLWERWVGDWTELQHIDPPTLLAITAILSRFPGLLNRGPGGPASAGTWFSFQHLLSNWCELPVHRVILLFYAHSIQTVNSQGYPLTSSTWCTCYLHWCISYFWQLDNVLNCDIVLDEIQFILHSLKGD